MRFVSRVLYGLVCSMICAAFFVKDAERILGYSGLLVSAAIAFLLLVVTFRRLFLTAGSFWARDIQPPPPPEDWPKITIFIPAFNEESVIEKCLDAIDHLDYPYDKLETVLINDGGSDDTEKIAREYMGKIQGFKILSRSSDIGGKGKPAALLHALSKYTDQEICFFVDADTTITPSVAKRAAAYLIYENVGAVTGRLEPRNPYDSVASFYSALESWTHQLTTLWPASRMGLTCAALGTNWAIRRDTLDGYGFGKDQLLEDIDISVAMNADGLEIIYDPDMVAQIEAPPNLKTYTRQHIGWARGFSVIGRNRTKNIIFGIGGIGKKIDRLIYTWGYFDRPLLFAYLLMIAANNFNPVFFATGWVLLPYFAAPLIQMTAAMHHAKRARADYFRLAWVPFMFLVDVAATVSAFLSDFLSRPALWYKTERRRDQ